MSYDLRGNLSASGASAYTYTSENRLATGPGGAALAYDSLGRLSQVYTTALSTNFDYDGTALIAERDQTSYALLRRYVHGPGDDAPILWYEGAGLTDKRYLMTDERGSIMSVTNSTGAVLGINAYDEYGIPKSTNIGRFGYTGQTWLPEIGMNYYKARMYSPTLGRFMQTDPIGYGDGMNWYAYVGSDPVNGRDPSGLGAVSPIPPVVPCDLICQIERIINQGEPVLIVNGFVRGGAFRSSGRSGRLGAGDVRGAGSGLTNGLTLNDSSVDDGVPIVVTARRRRGGGEPQSGPCPAANPGSPGTMTQNQVAMSRPGWQTLSAYNAAQDSLRSAQIHFPNLSLHNDVGDAFRHFRWNFAMTQSFGARGAAAFANAHEVSGPNPAGETAMDLQNNSMGRAFGSDPRYANLSPDKAALQALRSGCLQTGIK